jgi:serine/threonine protein kinase
MDLTAGARLGPYEIVSPLGAGGMGQVYKARDRRLDRTVAIKILPQSLAIDAEFRQRFDREARVIAQLDHPHIGALYDVGEERGTSYLVMQFLEGETLADRLHRGPLPIEEAIRYAIQVASALAVAHRAGIVHRDLKPGNVMLTSSGAKLLDFGLAKTTSPVESTIATQATVPPQLTTQGAIMGTFQYMAPEQIEGGNADSRSDVWGYGCVLYEMLTGTQPFQGKSSASLLANILNTEPPRLRERRPSVANALDYLVHRCLQKEPEARWQSMIDITHQLHWVAAIEEGQPARVTRPLWRHPAALVAVYILAIAAVVAVNALRKPLADPASPLHLTLLPPADLTLTPFASTGAPHFALSPDGERIAIRRLRRGAAADTLGPPTRFTRRAGDSPKSRCLRAFLVSGWRITRLFRRSAIENDPPRRRAPFGARAAPRCGRWHVKRRRRPRWPGWRADSQDTCGWRGACSSNGDRRRVGRPPLAAVSPDGRRFIYTQSRGSVMLASLDSTTTTQLLDGRATAVYDRNGWLLFSGGSGKLMGQAVDPATLAPDGTQREVLDGVRYAAGAGFPPVSLSARGVLAYWDGTTVATVLEWFDRHGSELPLPVPPAAGTFVIAPDGRQVAFSRSDGRADGATANTIWLMDAAGNASRFSYISDPASQPHWSADGRHLLFVSRVKGLLSLFRRPTSGVAKEQLIGTIAGGGTTRGAEFVEAYVGDWSRDEDAVVFSGARPTTGWDLFAAEVRTGQLTPLRETTAYEIQPRLSPDDRWLSYASNETGRWEVFVEPFPPSGPRWQISTDGGSQPLWRRDGAELFFLAPDAKLMSVTVTETSGAGFSYSAPRVLFQTRIRPTYAPFPVNYAVSPDGQRFLIEGVRPGTGPTISVATNWSPRD